MVDNNSFSFSEGDGSEYEYDENGSLKPLPSPTTVVPTPGGHTKPGGSSKARQKKFHRHFQQVAEEERVINYYSCALVGDFLLQGHLYITNNYFAFYSNVFGFVTKLLIPTASVIKISKEKTARIIPNAVGVATPDEKHVFGSFMSRDSAHRLMLQVWRATQPHEIPIIKGEPEVSECSVEDYSSGSGSGTDCSAIGRERPPVKIVPVVHTLSPLVAAVPSVPDGPIRRTAAAVVATSPEIRAPTITDATPLKPQVSSVPPRYSFLLIFSTALLTFLFLSAGVLLYRINLVHRAPTQDLAGGDLYSEVLRWQAELHSQSASEVQSVLDSHLHQIAKVRQSLEALSMLIMPEDSQQNKHTGTS